MNDIISLSPKTGIFSIHLPGYPPIRSQSRLWFGNSPAGGIPLRWKRERGSAKNFKCENKFGKWSLQFVIVTQPEGPTLRIFLRGRIKKNLPKLTLAPLCVRRLPADHVLEHGRAGGHCHLTLARLLKQKRPFRGGFQHILTYRGKSLQISNPQMQNHLTWITGSIHGNSTVDLKVETESGDAVRGQKICAEMVSLRVSSNGHDLMRSWAAENVEVKKNPAPMKAGWNSWDYYRWTVTEEDVLKNAEFIASDPVLSRHVRRIIVDDGWQYCYGEWEANSLFPSGMERLARKLRTMKFEAGLWIAPSIVEPQARIAQIQTEMLAKGESGLPCLSFSCMERHGFVLDPTVPKVQKHLFKIFRRYVSFGYSHFKLDFLRQTLGAPRFANPAVPRGKIIRTLLDPIRRATAAHATIMGCNYPFEAGNACVDEVRISSDILANWDAVRENSVSIASRFWSNGIFWRNDPDFVLCRGLETASDPDQFNLKPLLVLVKPASKDVPATYGQSLVGNRENEVKVLLSMALISGGMVNLSDNLPRLNRKGLQLARKVVAAENGKAGIPLDLFRSEHPSCWLQELGNRRARILLINWKDSPQRLGMDLIKQGFGNHLRATDFWTGKPVKILHGKIQSTLPPRSCLLTEVN
ncbi:MAG: alpha-galactosidase [Verrucomicrobiae bacterium]|nr:alpha-galactosidase [Verrucomicrobiae bacterium]